jgi:inhibitor of the pro-sigma K processing machinery
VDTNIVLAYAFGLLLLYVLVRLLFSPLKYALFILCRAAVGGLALLCLNLVGRLFGLHLPINPASMLCAGYLGGPGIVLLLLLQRVFA